MTLDRVRARMVWRQAIVAVAMRRGIDPADAVPESNRRLHGTYAHRVKLSRVEGERGPSVEWW